jgi:hypothetical protein
MSNHTIRALTDGQFKPDDEIIDVPGGSAVCLAPAVTRSIWNEVPTMPSS